MDKNNNDENLVWAISPMQWAIVGLIALLLGYIFFDGLNDMLTIWSSSEEYGYAYLIPAISAFLIWQRKDILETIKFNGSWFGVLIVLAGIIIYFIGYFATVYAIIEYGLVITIFGIVLSTVGTQAFKKIWIPLLFLFFMIPLPQFIYQTLSSSLQLISSELGVMVIRAFGISVFLEGNVIDLGSYKLQVVEACSGLRYLFPLMALSFMTVYFFNTLLWIRALVFLSSIPITVLMNSLRIGVIGILVEYGGPEQAEGFLHDFEGWAVFMLCIAVILLEMWLFMKFFGNNKKLSEAFIIEMPNDTPADAVIKTRNIPKSLFANVAILLIAGLITSVVDAREEVIPKRSSFLQFPREINEWSGITGYLERKYLDALKLDDYIIADYADKDEQNKKVNFYVAYYNSQKAGVSAHSPRACIPGGGWRIDSLEQTTLNINNNNGEPLAVNRLLIKKDENVQLVYYWFLQRGRNLTSEYSVKWYLLWDAISINRTDGALVRITTPVYKNEDISHADSRLTDFTKELIPILDEYVPR